MTGTIRNVMMKVLVSMEGVIAWVEVFIEFKNPRKLHS